MREIGKRIRYNNSLLSFDKGFKLAYIIRNNISPYNHYLFTLSIYIHQPTLWSIGFSNILGLGYNLNPHTKELFKPVKANKRHRELESLLKNL